MFYLSRIKPFALAAILALIAATAGKAADGNPEYVEMTLGNPDAGIVVTEYASFTCPHC